MGFHVRSNVSALRKAFPTHFTRVRPSPCVTTFMCLEITELREPLPTIWHLASIGPLSSMGSNVDIQMSFLVEALATPRNVAVKSFLVRLLIKRLDLRQPLPLGQQPVIRRCGRSYLLDARLCFVDACFSLAFGLDRLHERIQGSVEDDLAGGSGRSVFHGPDKRRRIRCCRICRGHLALALDGRAQAALNRGPILTRITRLSACAEFRRHDAQLRSLRIMVMLKGRAQGRRRAVRRVSPVWTMGLILGCSDVGHGSSGEGGAREEVRSQARPLYRRRGHGPRVVRHHAGVQHDILAAAWVVLGPASPAHGCWRMGCESQLGGKGLARKSKTLVRRRCVFPSTGN